MHLRATAVLVVTKPAATKTYRVWLVKQLQFRDISLYECKTLYLKRPRTLCSI
jgi:hypothetical protein